MANRGDSFTNPVTGEHCVVRESDPAAGRTLVDLYVEPGGAVAGEHVHDNLVERFEVIEGRVGFTIDGGEELAEPGRRAEVAAGVAHDGKVNKTGMPDPLQLALVATEFEDVIRFTKPPRAVQKALFGILAPIARARGKAATYAHHRGVVVTPGEARVPAA